MVTAGSRTRRRDEEERIILMKSRGRRMSRWGSLEVKYFFNIYIYILQRRVSTVVLWWWNHLHVVVVFPIELGWERPICTPIWQQYLSDGWITWWMWKVGYIQHKTNMVGFKVLFFPFATLVGGWHDQTSRVLPGCRTDPQWVLKMGYLDLLGRKQYPYSAIRS